MAKYYTIAEVSSMIGTSKSNLRYLETTIKKFRIKKIRGRRYYTETNIEQLQATLQKKGFELPQMELFKPQDIIPKEVANQQDNNEAITRIENLAMKFKELQNRIELA